MDKFAIILAIAALAGVGWVISNQQGTGSNAELAEEVALLRGENADFRERLDKMDRGHTPATLDGGLPKTVAGNAGGNAPGQGANGDVPFEERLARVEALVNQQGDTLAEVKEDAKKAPRGMPFLGGRKRFLSNADDAAKALKLSDAQKSDMERVLESARHELVRLYDTQNDDGMTITELNKEMGSMITSAEKVDHSKILSHVGKLAAFKRGKVPGSNETFAQAERRINKNAMDEIGRGLSHEQKKEWDQAEKSALLPGGGTTASFVMTSELPTPSWGPSGDK